MADEFKGIGNESLRNVEALKSSMQEITSATKQANKSLKSQNTLLAAYQNNFDNITKSANKFAELQDKARRSASATTEAFKEQSKQLSIVRSLNAQIDNLYDQILKADEKHEKALRRQVENLSAARDNARELAREFGNLVDDSSKLDKSTMWFSAFSQFIGDIPGLRKLSSPFDAAAQASRETVLNNAKNKQLNESINSLGAEALKTGKGLTAEKLKEKGLSEIVGKSTGSAAASRLRAAKAVAKTESAGMAGLQAGFKALGPAISKAFVPLAIITTLVEVAKFFIDAMFEADKSVTNIAKSLNINKEAAADVYMSFASLKEEAPMLTNILEGNLLLRRDFIKTQLQFNELLGMSVDLSKEENKELAAQLTNANKFLKLNDEEFKGLVGLYAQTGETVDDIKNTILGTTKAYKLQTGLQIDERKILGDVLKTSNAIKLSIKGGVDALIQATINANKFGISLDQLDNTSDSLLNFEQSISDELNAELLLGRDINLERARAAAFTNDQVALTEEVGNLVKGFGPDFQRNALAQDAFAKVLGKSKKEIADMYTTYLENEKLSQAQQKAAIKLTDKEIELLESKGEAGKKVVADMQAGTLTGVEFYNALKEAGFEGKKLTEALGELSQQSLAAQSAEEKFSDALESAKETFAEFVTGGYLDDLADTLVEVIKYLQGYTEGEEEAVKTIRELKQKGDLTEEELKELDALKKIALDEKGWGGTLWEHIKNPTLNYGLYRQVFKNFQAQDAQEAIKKLKDEKLPISSTDTQVEGKDFVIKTLEEDTIVAAGGTNLGRTDEMVSLLKDLIHATNSGKNVYIDSSKVTGALKLTDYKSNFGKR